MKFSLSLGVLRTASPEEKKMLAGGMTKDSYMFSRMLDQPEKYFEGDIIYFDLDKFAPKDFPKLWSFANKNDVNVRTINTIQRWHDAIKNPLNAEVPDIKAFKQMVISILKETTYKWLMRETDDGYTLPVLVTNVEYHPARKFSPAYVSINYRYGFYFSSSEYSHSESHKITSGSISFHDHDLVADGSNNDDEEYEVSTMYDTKELVDYGTDDEDDEDGEETTPKKKIKKPAARKTKSRRLNLLEILSNDNLFLPTEATLKKFFDDSLRCKELSTKMGKQYISTTKASIRADDERRYYTSREMQPMQEEGVPYRLVVDMNGLPNGIERQHNTTHFDNQLIPYWPYVRCYNLTKYNYVSVHAASLQEYAYNKDITKNVVMDSVMKDYLNAIMGGEEVYTDIIAGKSGGMIVLASGRPGLGKTLTAEAYSETMERPLYQIQSSQLGIDIEDIEKKLIDILRRTERWSAVLLIDECDTYVRKREKDIVQNCIVGVFLRLLEYFSGVMFLTTNMHDIIDEAILSRCTSHIKFETPTVEQRKEMLKIHCRIQGVSIADKEADLIANRLEMSGRDIRNMIKNVKKANHHKKGELKVTSEMISKIEKFIPFIK